MVWYDDLYSRVRVEDALGALIRLGGKGTLRQIEKDLLKKYELPKGMFKDKEQIKEPLDKLIKWYGAVELKKRIYTLKEDFLKCKNLKDFFDTNEKLCKEKKKELIKLYETKKSIDDYVKGELVIKFEKDIDYFFAKDFINLFGYEILDMSRYETDCFKGQMQIRIPKGKEHEIISTLKDYKRIVKAVSVINDSVKGYG